VRVGRQPRDLHGRLTDLVRLREAALHLERVAAQQHQGNEQPALADRASDRHAALGAGDGIVVVL
jgi:hypothetical protein